MPKYFMHPILGDDTKPGTETEPWKSVSHANGRLNPGDYLYFRGGSYNEIVTITRSGQPGHPIIYLPYQGEPAVIDGLGISDTSSFGLVRFSDVSWIDWEGIEVCRSNGAGMGAGHYGPSASHINIRRTKIHDTWWNGFRASAGAPGSHTHHILIEYCDLYDVNKGDQQEALDFQAYDGGRISDFEARYCKVHDQRREAISVMAYRDIGRGRSIIENGSIHHCETYNNNPRVGYYIDAMGGTIRNVDVYASVARDSVGSGMSYSTEHDGGILERVRFFNDLVYRCKDGISNMPYTGSSLIDVQMFCNTLADCYRYQMHLLDNSDEYTRLVIANNILKGDSYLADKGNLEANHILDSNHFGSGDGFGTNKTIGDPKFVGSEDFHLQPDSPCRNAASVSYAPTKDIDGIPRPQGAGVDIGAYEYKEVHMVIHNESSADFTFEVLVPRHDTETTVAAFPTANPSEVKQVTVNVVCTTAGDDLSGKLVEIMHGTNIIATGTVGVPINVSVPNTPGVYAWTARFPEQ